MNVDRAWTGRLGGRGAAQFSETPAGDPRLVASVDLENCTMPSTPDVGVLSRLSLDIGRDAKVRSQLIRHSCV